MRVKSRDFCLEAEKRTHGGNNIAMAKRDGRGLRTDIFLRVSICKRSVQSKTKRGKGRGKRGPLVIPR